MKPVTARQRELLARASVAALLVIGLLYAVAQLSGIPPEAHDAKAYWLADPANAYIHKTVGDDYAYLYSPAFLQAIAPLKALPWPVFSCIWTGLLVVALGWTARAWALPLLVFQPVVASIVMGNIEMLLAAAVVVGFRWPAAWAFVLLSKVTPGVGLVWFLVRREWRSLAIALGSTAAIAASSFAIAPAAWRAWTDLLLANTDVHFRLWTIPGPLWLRVALAAALVAWGARTDRQWTVPVAAGLALPVAYGTAFGLMLVGAVGTMLRDGGSGSVLARLARMDRRIETLPDQSRRIASRGR